MSVSGSVPKDLATTNLVVKATTATNSATTLNLESQLINAVPYQSALFPIYSVTGTEIGTLTVIGQQIRLLLIAVLNEDPVNTIPADTTFATVPGWNVSQPLTFPGFLYNPGSATIADAGTSVEILLLPGGNIQGLSPLPPKTIGVISNEGPKVTREPNAPCNIQNGYLMCIVWRSDRGSRYGIKSAQCCSLREFARLLQQSSNNLE
jgi:hypothetical protein